jgi:hypothetical protein
MCSCDLHHTKQELLDHLVNTHGISMPPPALLQTVFPGPEKVMELEEAEQPAHSAGTSQSSKKGKRKLVVVQEDEDEDDDDVDVDESHII